MTKSKDLTNSEKNFCASIIEKSAITYQQYLEAKHPVQPYGKQVPLLRAEIKMDMDSVYSFLGDTEDTKNVDLPLTPHT